MSHHKNLRNRETGIRRLAVNINMLILELGSNNYENCGVGQHLSFINVDNVKKTPKAK